MSVGSNPLTMEPSSRFVAGSTTRLALRGGAPSARIVFLAGLQRIDLPLFGGTLVPLPTVLVPWSTSVDGAAALTFAWPPAAPGTEVYFQAWCLDPLAPQGFSASNGLVGASQ